MFQKISSVTLLSIALTALLQSETLNEQQYFRRIQCHLTVKDPNNALKESQEALEFFPNSLLLHESIVRVLAALGDEKGVIKAWEEYLRIFPDQNENRNLLEDISWGFLNKSSTSSSLVIRDISLIAALFSNEGRGVDLLHQGMKDPNYAIRSVAINLSSNLRDSKLIDQICSLYDTEKTWVVRQEIIRAIGKMKIEKMKGELEKLIGSSSSTASEQSIASEALLNIFEEINPVEIRRLALSDRMGHRLFACEAIAYFQSTRDVGLLLILADDPISHIRSAAFQALGMINTQEKKEDIIVLARQGIKDADPEVAVSAAWLLSFFYPEEGAQTLAKHLKSQQQELRLLAAGAINAAGLYTASLAKESFLNHEDPFVKLNLALGLASQHIQMDECSQCIESVFINDHQRWMQKQKGIFQWIAPQKGVFQATSLMTPEMENQMTRLLLLNRLAILKTPQALSLVRQFLSERSWGITGAAAALLLTEGDESSIELIKSLLNDPQAKVRIQAALVLSIWSREDYAISVLQQEYAESDRETKMKIIEAIGRIGSMKSIPFLMNVMKEPSQSIRVIGATAIIQCVNH